MLNVYVDVESNTMVSYSESGEIIIWDYNQGKELKKLIFSEGQFTQKSYFSFKENLITSYGYQGEFNVINYID